MNILEIVEFTDTAVLMLCQLMPQHCKGNSAWMNLFLNVALLTHCGLVMLWHWKSWLTLVLVMACCALTPSHYLNQCWLECWRDESPNCVWNVHRVWNVHISNPSHSTRGQWVRPSVFAVSICVCLWSGATYSITGYISFTIAQNKALPITNFSGVLLTVRYYQVIVMVAS